MLTSGQVDWQNVANVVETIVPAVVPQVKLALIALTAASAVSSQITSMFPAPTSGPFVPVWGVLNWFARNVKFAQNAPPPAPPSA